MRESMVPSFCATWRICSAWEWGIASCNWNAMDCRIRRSSTSGRTSRATGFFGSRRANASRACHGR